MWRFIREMNIGDLVRHRQKRNESGNDILTGDVAKIHQSSRFAICVNNTGYPVSLELHEIYQLLPDQDTEVNGEFRVVDESGEDYLYPVERFVLVELP